jgi:hypothetical protein
LDTVPTEVRAVLDNELNSIELSEYSPYRVRSYLRLLEREYKHWAASAPAKGTPASDEHINLMNRLAQRAPNASSPVAKPAEKPKPASIHPIEKLRLELMSKTGARIVASAMLDAKTKRVPDEFDLDPATNEPRFVMVSAYPDANLLFQRLLANPGANLLDRYNTVLAVFGRKLDKYRLDNGLDKPVTSANAEPAKRNQPKHGRNGYTAARAATSADVIERS